MDRALLRASAAEISKLEYRVAFLATTATITPYIGLFGTVWGIMAAFQAIADAGSTSLAVVAPPIAEALVATAPVFSRRFRPCTSTTTSRAR